MLWCYRFERHLGNNPHPERIHSRNAAEVDIVQLLPSWAWSEPIMVSAGQEVRMRELGYNLIKTGVAGCSQGLLHLEVALPMDAVLCQSPFDKPATAQQRSNNCQ